MKIQVSLSKSLSKFKIGSRIIINAGTKKKPEYYTVTVTNVDKNVVEFMWDNGEEGIFDDIKDYVGKANEKRNALPIDKEYLHEYLKKPPEVKNRVWVISDVHGCADQLEKLLLKIRLKPSDRVFISGDHIDRGPNAKGVIDIIMRHKNIVPLMGNHEDMFLKSFVSNKHLNNWLRKGGKEVLDSFGVNHPSKIPQKYIQWFRKLRLYARYKNFVVSHAGVDLNSSKDPFRVSPVNKSFILWNRTVRAPKNKKMRITVGHTPVSMQRIQESAKTGKVMIDGGCVYGGKLVAFCLDNDEIVSVPGHKKSRSVKIRTKIPSA